MNFSFIFDALSSISNFLGPYNFEVAMTMVATLLVVYGDVLNKKIKKIISPYHFIIRTTVFILICAFGYGAIILFTTPFVQDAIKLIPYTYRGLSVVLIFMLSQIIIQKKQHQ